MAGTTAFFFDHFLQFGSVADVLPLLSEKLGAPVLQATLDEHYQFRPALPKGFEGWVLVTEEGDNPDDADLLELLRPATDESIFLMDGIAEYTGEKIDQLADWKVVGTYTEALAKGIAVPQRVDESLRALAEIAQQFGASHYLLFDKDAHEPLVDALLDGEPFAEALRKNKPVLSAIEWGAALPKVWTNSAILHKL